jgi:SAM-dependent methyltransferase
MHDEGIDAGAFRARQREQWNVAATGWRDWSELTDRGGGDHSRRMVELAGVTPGSRVLDVACGYGEPGLTAARAAAPGGSVVATDISAEMITFGRQRAARAGVDNIEFVEAMVSELDFPPASFDAAVSRWGIIFDPDGEGSAELVRGLLKPGARFAISSWGPPDEVPFLTIPMRTALRVFDAEPPPPGPGPLSRPTPEALAGLLEGGGFSDIRTERGVVTFEWESPADFVRYVHEIAPPVNALIDPHPPELQQAAWDAIRDAVAEAAGGDGPVRLDNGVIIAAGMA